MNTNNNKTPTPVAGPRDNPVLRRILEEVNRNQGSSGLLGHAAAVKAHLTRKNNK